MDIRSRDLQLTMADANGHRVVRVAGDIDISTAPTLDAYLIDAITASGTDLVVDLTAVTFMDASGLSVLLRARTRATRAGGRLRLAPPPPAIARLLAITRLDGRLTT